MDTMTGVVLPGDSTVAFKDFLVLGAMPAEFAGMRSRVNNHARKHRGHGTR